MSDGKTPDDNKIPPHDAAFEVIALQADQLEQLSRNLKRAANKYLSMPERIELGGYKIGSYGGEYRVLQGDRAVSPPTSYQEATKNLDSIATSRITYLANALHRAGRAAHKVQLERKALSKAEAESLSDLPSHLDDAVALLQRVVAIHKPEGDKADDMVRFQADIDFIKEFAKNLGNAGQILETHSHGMVERQAKLRKVQDIEADRTTRYSRGMEFLKRSHEHAEENNPSYRDHITKEAAHIEKHKLPTLSYEQAEKARQAAKKDPEKAL